MEKKEGKLLTDVEGVFAEKAWDDVRKQWLLVNIMSSPNCLLI